MRTTGIIDERAFRFVISYITTLFAERNVLSGENFTGLLQCKHR